MKDLYVRGIKIDWSMIPGDSYLRGIAAISRLEALELKAPVTFFSGENGTGKSTLLEAIAIECGFNVEGGTRNYHFSTYEDASELHNALRLVRGVRRPRAGWFFRAESFFNVATAALRLYDDGSEPDYHARSHGESFLDFMQTAHPAGLNLMDEPEAALSPQRQLTLLIHIAQMAREGAQFIIATHSPILLGVPGAQILGFGDDGIHPCRYEDTESYQITKLFLDNPARMIECLMAEG